MRRRLRGCWIFGAVVAVTLSACSAESQVDATPPVQAPAPPAPSTTVAELVESSTPAPSVEITTATRPTVDAPATTIAAPQQSRGPTPEMGLAVRAVTDGDTFTLADGRRVRLAQVDAPETNQCFGAESTAALRALVENNAVTLRRPSNGPEKDRYGRTVAEVSVAARSVNEQLVRDGAAKWYERFAPEDAELAGRLRSAESEARTIGRGLWSACVGGASSASPPTTQAGEAHGRNCHPAYPDDCIPPAPPDLNCPDIKRKVRVDHAHGDPHGFDRDKDGWGCDSYG